MKHRALHHRYGHAGRRVPLERVRRALLNPSSVPGAAGAASKPYTTLIFLAAKQYGYVEKTPRWPNLYAAERFLEDEVERTIGWA